MKFKRLLSYLFNIDNELLVNTYNNYIDSLNNYSEYFSAKDRKSLKGHISMIKYVCKKRQIEL